MGVDVSISLGSPVGWIPLSTSSSVESGWVVKVCGCGGGNIHTGKSMMRKYVTVPNRRNLTEVSTENKMFTHSSSTKEKLQNEL